MQCYCPLGAPCYRRMMFKGGEGGWGGSYGTDINDMDGEEGVDLGVGQSTTVWSTQGALQTADLARVEASRNGSTEGAGRGREHNVGRDPRQRGRRHPHKQAAMGHGPGDPC